MANTVKWNVIDTPLAGSTVVGKIQPTTLNFSKDFAKKGGKDGEAIITNLTSPLDCSETVRFAYSKVNNIYAQTGIDPNVYAASRLGFSVLSQLNTTLTSTTESGHRIDLPLTAHLVLRGPASEDITGTIIASMISRLIGTLFEEGAATPDARINSLIRGAVLPKALA